MGRSFVGARVPAPVCVLRLFARRTHNRRLDLFQGSFSPVTFDSAGFLPPTPGRNAKQTTPSISGPHVKPVAEHATYPLKTSYRIVYCDAPFPGRHLMPELERAQRWLTHPHC